MWRWLLACAMFARAASADPPIQPPIQSQAVRKPVTEAYTAEMISKFVDAIIADKARDLWEAVKLYEQVSSIAPQANTYYNLADVQRRMDDNGRAIRDHKKYLEV